MEAIFQESVELLEKGDTYKAYLQVEHLFSSSSAKKSQFATELLLKVDFYGVYSIQFFALFNQIEMDKNNQKFIDLFLQKANYRQLQPCLNDLLRFVQKYESFLEKNKLNLKGLKGVSVAVEQLQAIETKITPVHVVFCKMCIATKQYRLGASVCGRVLIGSGNENKSSAKDVHSYAYYAAVIFTA